MKTVLLALVLVAFSASAVAQESPPPQKKKSNASGFTSRDATVFSVMGWGIALGVGIAVLCALVDSNNTSSSHSH